MAVARTTLITLVFGEMETIKMVCSLYSLTSRP